MRSSWNFFSADQLIFGSGAIERLGEFVVRYRLQRVLIVTDVALVDAGIVAQVQRPLACAGATVEIFSGGQPEPSIEVAHQAMDASKKFLPDGIVGVGGGSNMDLSKFTAAVATHGGQPSDYFGWDKIPGPVIPLACVATTSGTGSEVSHAAVLTDTKNEMKVSSLSNYLRPALALVDPKLTLTCPPQATADSGIDALTHAIEAYSAVDYDQLDVPAGESWPYDGRHPLGSTLAEKAITLVGQHLVTAVREPSNLTAREGMSLAATLAGMAFSNCGVAIVHALEYPLGGTLHCSHGLGNGLLLPYVMRYNLPQREETFAHVAKLLGEKVDALETQQAAEKAILAVENLKRDIGIPERIRDIGGTVEQLPLFAEKSFAIKRLMSLNPRRPSQEDLLDILRSAL